ncbi:MAG: metallophosphoesterase [Lachnospiraceae bacterium]|nr:metallophosphoesterase [Lachnospiraceae bacterium]
MDKRQRKKRNKYVILFLILLLLVWGWTWKPVTEHIILPLFEEEGDNVRIALITDLHSCYYGKNQQWLINRVMKEQPDLVILSGDIYDNRLPDKNAQITIKRLAERFPTYYVTGNHEFWSGRAEQMKENAAELGAQVLAGDCTMLSVGSRKLDICGVDDPTDMASSEWQQQIRQAYEQTKEGHLRILVSHRPEKVFVYQQYDFDLVLAGHAHAGQFRIPFLNKGLFAPDQGFMAEYVNGVYPLQGESTMVVSRGLARETTPMPRFFNHPEVVILDITTKD